MIQAKIIDMLFNLTRYSYALNSKIFAGIAVFVLLFGSSSNSLNFAFASDDINQMQKEIVPPTFNKEISTKIPVIILFKDKPTDKHINLIKSIGGVIKRTYNIINGFAADIPKDKLEILKHNPLVISVDPDVILRVVDINSVRKIGADQIWTTGNTGQGTTIAILDTGIDTTHPEFSGRILKCHSEIPNTSTCFDDYGHGTHVAGIAGAAGINSVAKGIAPATSFYVDKVMDATGSGSLSGIIAGIDWAKANGAKVISMSLGTGPLTTTEPNCDTAIPSFTTAINNAVAAGITVIASAGNSGSAGVGAPGCISNTIAVAAVDSTDTNVWFSSRGGAVADHGISAPGAQIYSSLPTGNCPLCKPSGYGYLDGTSMAAPQVSGTVALMLKGNPSLSPSSIKKILFATACTTNTNPACPTGAVPNSIYGYGRINALDAYTLATTLDYSLNVIPSSATIIRGDSTIATVSISLLGYLTKPVSLTATLPTPTTGMISSSFSPSTGIPSYTSSVAITTTQDTSPGTYFITIIGSGGGVTHSTNYVLTVVNPLLSVSEKIHKPNNAKGDTITDIVTVTTHKHHPPGGNPKVKVAGATIELTIKDPSGNIVSTQTGITDIKGNAQFEYAIPTNAASGIYTAEATASSTGYLSGSTSEYFRVRS